MTSYHVIGQPIPRVDGHEKVTGTATYTADVTLPGMLWGKALRSPFPHARVVRIDTSKAEQVPGVRAVLTGADVRGLLFGRTICDVPVLAQERVRFAGEKVAAVAADDEDVAQQAVDLIEVEYEELPPLLDPEEAAREGSPLLHPDLSTYAGLPFPLEKASNVFIDRVYGKGDVAAGLAQADQVFEETFTTPRVHQAYIEPRACVVWIDEDGVVQVWATNKTPYTLKRQLAAALGMPEERVRVHPSHIGGDFGGKGPLMDEPLCYFLALRTKSPVKMVMDYTEEFMAGNPRHASVMRVKAGVRRDGTLTALDLAYLVNSGAYAGFIPNGHLLGASGVGDNVRVPHARIALRHVYTNCVPGGYMRAPGETQGTFALESHIDSVARQLGMDPVEFRMKNLVQEGDESPTGHHLEEVRAKETLEAALEASAYDAPKPPNVGRGVAMSARAASPGETHAALTLGADGTAHVQTSLFEQGTGTYTVMRQIVAEELGIPIHRVRLSVWNTDMVEFDSGVAGTRTMRMAVPAIYEATQEARRQLLRLASDLLGWPEAQLAQEGDYLYRGDTGERMPWMDLLARLPDGAVTGRAHVRDMSRLSITSFVAQVAEVSVDPETGHVKLLRFTTAHDVGTVMNPLGHQGQIAGAVVQGFGYGLTEELKVEDGRVVTMSFADYKIPNVMDIPPLHTVLVESESGTSPYKIKGIGEPPLPPVAAAIVNAVADAVGVRIRDLPVTAEKVYRALRKHPG